MNINKRIRIALLLAFACGLAVAEISTTYFHIELAFIKCTMPEDPLEAWSEGSYIVWQYNSTFYACRNMSVLMVEAFSDNDTDVLQYAINETTTWGGTVYVKSPTYTGTYNASVTLKDNVTLILQTGAAGITVTIDSGATAWLYDYETDEIKKWTTGTLKHHIRDGEVLLAGAWHTTPLSEASYIIGEYNSTHFYARNHTGYGTSANLGYEMLSSNASNIGNWCIGNLTNGGMIFVKDANYTIKPAWNITNDYIHLKAESWNTILFAGDGLKTSVITNKWRSGYHWKGIIIEGFQINGNADGVYQWTNPTGESFPNYTGGIGLCDTLDVKIFNNYIHHTNQSGILVSAGYGVTGRFAGEIAGNVMEFCSWNGISASSNFAEGFLVHDNVVRYSSDVGIMASSNYTRIYDNEVWDMNGTDGSVDTQWAYAVEGSNIWNVRFENNLAVNCLVGFDSSSTHRYIYFIDNLIEGATENALLSDGNYIYIEDNDFYECKTHVVTITGDYCTFIGNRMHNSVVDIGDWNSFLYIQGNNNTIQDNSFWNLNGDEKHKAIYIYGGDWNYVIDNTFDWATASYCTAIEIDNDGDNNAISGNIFRSAQVGLSIENANCNNTWIQDNDFIGCTSNDVSDSGTGTTYGNNRWNDGTYDNTP